MSNTDLQNKLQERISKIMDEFEIGPFYMIYRHPDSDMCLTAHRGDGFWLTGAMQTSLWHMQENKDQLQSDL